MSSAAAAVDGPAATATSAVTVHRDVVFDRPVGYRPLALDLYVPAAPTSTLCIYLHGGGWRVGSRRDGPGAAKTWFFAEVAALGLAVASVDYRLSGEACYPAQQHDVAAAAVFLGEHGADFGLAAARTVVWGVSAGGHLAAIHALDHAGQIAAAVCWYTPTDLETLAADIVARGAIGDRSAESREGRLIGAALDDAPDLVAAASPVRHVRGPDGSAPPFLFIHGGADVGVPARQSSRLAEALIGAGGRATVEIVDGATHMFPELGDDATRDLVRRSVDFLRAD